MDRPSLFHDSDDSVESSISHAQSHHPSPAAGGILVLDKHITQATLHRPLEKWKRRDLVPFLIIVAILLFNALPALWYEAQVSWIRSAEIPIDETATAIETLPSTSVINNAALANQEPKDELLEANEELSFEGKIVNATEEAIKEIQRQVDALYVPDNYHFWFMYLLPLSFFLSAIMWLVLYWNVRLQILLRYADTGSIDSIKTGAATHVRVIPVEHGGKSEICAIQHSNIPPTPSSVSSSSSASGVKETFFYFQKTKYLLHESTLSTSQIPQGHVNAWFAPVEFPTHMKLQEYIDHANSSSAGSIESIDILSKKYGENVFDIPLPPFADLMKEHALAPFFVFQIFCVLLWCLDEYWYYSLFTLFMLVTFEATVVQRRLKNLEFLREMRIKPYQVQVWRGKKWTSVPTSALVPYDIISLVRPMNEQNIVPADILLLTGNVVVNESMLTGESVPVQKENITVSNDSMDETLALNKVHKRNVIFGGTKILLSNPSNPSDEGLTNVRSPPDGGSIGFVLRTGFNTSQGKLVRTILFSSESVSVNNMESLLFIGVLLIFAIAASAYVCIKGLEDENRSRYKLMLSCIMIITSVVPPELPMELSLAVNTSLLALMRQHIFCTEPFRIPLAGAVDICCFDKTGTLTSDEFVVKGIAGVSPSTENGNQTSASSSSSSSSSSLVNLDGLLSQQSSVPLASKYVIAGCHSLTFLPESAVSKEAVAAAAAAGPSASDPHLIGDPLEKSALAFIEWNVGRTDTASSKAGRERLRLLHKYPFSSELKRMSSIVALEHEPGAPLRVVTKGAAEVMEHMFRRESMPDNFTHMYTSYAQQGCRVLALGWKELPDLRDLPDDRKRLKGLTRDSIESELNFAGFLVLQCPLKPDSREVVLSLKASSHQVMMISGDHALTCCHVALQTGITTRETLILQTTPDGRAIEWVINTIASENDTTPRTLPFVYDYTRESLRALTRQYDLCVTGEALEYLMTKIFAAAVTKPAKAAATARIALFVSRVRVFARASPDQKELVIHWLKTHGYTTLMSGDGSNDSPSLKQADVGVALISEDAANIAKKKASAAAAAKASGQSLLTGKDSTLAKIRAMQQAAANTPGGPAAQKAQLQKQLQEQLKQLEADMGGDENTTPRLGDASIASPFTSKLPFITSCVDIIRQGRCTLVTTLQMFNILGINSLISAYSMSVLYLDGVKWGDTQMTISSLSIAMFFLCVSRSQPLKQLSAERPHKNLFTASMILSVLGQFAIHMFILLTAINSATPHTPTTEEHRSPDKTFKPNVLNTVVYLVSNTQTIATFAANYRGRPFMESLSENSGLYKSLVFTFGLMMLLASELIPEMNSFLELQPLPSEEFRQELIFLLLADVAITWVYAKVIRRVFAVKPSKEQIEFASGISVTDDATVKKNQ